MTISSKHMWGWKRKWQLRKDKPKDLKESMWQGLQKYWSLPETVEESRIQSQNRHSDRKGKGMAVHNFGSKSFKRREEELATENHGEKPDFIIVMEDTHTNKKTKQIQDQYVAELIAKLKKQRDERLAELPQVDSTIDGETPTTLTKMTREDINKMVLEEARDARGRHFGLGSLTAGTQASTAPPYTVPPIVAAAIKEVENAKNKEIAGLKDTIASLMKCKNKFEEVVKKHVPHLPGLGSSF